ncbi:MAG: acyl-CoA synthetase (AMP-forming)/AMP-acid ligase II [Verrucomicrobiales bacterium]|jgi:acyl-CoA synthetase (AMP-forming)/AMP-acid ligase II
MKNICKVLGEVARRQPDTTALVDCSCGRKRQLSFGDLDAITAGGARQLTDAGLKPGDTVLFFHPVSIELYTALLSVFRAGMTAMFVDPSAGRAFIDACCALREPQGFFGSPKAHLLRFGSRAVRQIPVKFHRGGRWLPGSWCWAPVAGERGAPSVGSGAPALITFTSGSTGRPKAVARSHEFLIAQHQALENALELRSGEVDLITLPVFTLANLGSGLTSVLADTDLAKPGEADVEKVAQQIEATCVERVAASPAFFEAMLEKPGSLSKLKRISTGGAPVFPPLLERLAQAAPEAEVFAVYGSTEAEPIAHVNQREISVEDLESMRAGGGLLVGEPVVEIELRIIDDQWGTPIRDEPEALPTGSVGEIVVSGDHVLSGYLNGVGDEETKFTIGGQIWHRTGDAGRLDDSGRLWLMGRCAAKMQHGSIYPFAVECALSFLPVVKRCAALEHEGKNVLAIEVTEGAEISEIRQLVGWAAFEHVIRMAEIPMDLRHQAKVDYGRLRKLLRSHLS